MPSDHDCELKRIHKGEETIEIEVRAHAQLNSGVTYFGRCFRGPLPESPQVTGHRRSPPITCAQYCHHRDLPNRFPARNLVKLHDLRSSNLPIPRRKIQRMA